MQLNEFLEKFSPVYENDRKSKRMFACNESLMNVINRQYFPEALQNFADRICEEQRENCLNNACIDELSIDGVWVASLVDKSTILDAEQPKIEEL